MASEKILSIKSFTNSEEEGYKVTTTEQEIVFGICNERDCCEVWGYFTTEDDVQEFINADLLNIEIVDEALNTKRFFDKCTKENVDSTNEECAMMFVNFTTSKGVFQFVAYNIHNGYYSHPAFIRSKQLTASKSL